MARAYASIKRYAEAVSLTQTGLLRIREARHQLTLLSHSDPTPEIEYFPLPEQAIATLETTITRDETGTKRDWFAFNGGAASSSSPESASAFKKPLFYDIAFNELEDPLGKLQKRAGKAVTAAKKAPAVSSVTTETQQQANRAKIDEEPAVAEPSPEPPRASVLSSLLGGWWGRR